MIDYRPTMIRNVNRLSPEQASRWLAAYAGMPLSCNNQLVRDLTDGFSSQSINAVTKGAVLERSRGKRVSRRLLGI